MNKTIKDKKSFQLYRCQHGCVMFESKNPKQCPNCKCDVSQIEKVV